MFINIPENPPESRAQVELAPSWGKIVRNELKLASLLEAAARSPFHRKKDYDYGSKIPKNRYKRNKSIKTRGPHGTGFCFDP